MDQGSTDLSWRASFCGRQHDRRFLGGMTILWIFFFFFGGGGGGHGIIGLYLGGHFYAFRVFS